MTMQNPKREFKKTQFKEEFRKRIKQLILNLIQFADYLVSHKYWLADSGCPPRRVSVTLNPQLVGG